MPSTNSILPEYQNLKLGDHVPDCAPETGVHFAVEMLEPHKLLVLRSESHMPPWPTTGGDATISPMSLSGDGSARG
jgi:hypothetical protein